MNHITDGFRNEDNWIETGNPYQSPAVQLAHNESEEIDELPPEFLRRLVTIDQYKAFSDEWTPEQHVRRIVHVRIRQLLNDSSYRSYALSFSHAQRRNTDHSYLGSLELSGMNSFVLHPDNTVTAREYGNYPWPRYRFTLEQPLIIQYTTAIGAALSYLTRRLKIQ